MTTIRPEPRVKVILTNRIEMKVLLGQRKNGINPNTLNFPGGHLEWFESLQVCAERELEEETGFLVGVNYDWIDNSPCAFTNDIFPDVNKHYLTMYLRARYIQGKPRIMEPKKWESWGWYARHRLSGLNISQPIKDLLRGHIDIFGDNT